MSKYDVVVIGTGTAGQTVAHELKRKGLAVAAVEKSDTPNSKYHNQDIRHEPGK